MADSPSRSPRPWHSRPYSEIPRGMARQSRPLSASDGSSLDGSAHSRFDPDNEAVFSTRQLEDVSRQMSRRNESRRSPDRYSYAEEDHDISLPGAAADFYPAAAHPDGEGPDNMSESIEIGRGPRRDARLSAAGFRPDEFSSDMLGHMAEDTKHSFQGVDIHEDRDRSPALPSAFPVRAQSAAQRKPKTHVSNDLFAVEDKENNHLRTGLAKTADYGSRHGSNESDVQRTRAKAMNATVSDGDGDDNVSLLSDGRPPTVDLTWRSTRFGRPKPRASSAVAPPKNILPVAESRNTRKPAPNPQTHTAKYDKRNEAMASNTVTTQYSYLLPDLPNITELVSGVYQDGTPVFSRHGPARSRFGSLNRRPDEARSGHNHAAIESLPVPSEERAILVSLRLLQDKVAELERERADDERVMGDLRAEVKKLRTEKKDRERRLRADSALGLVDSGSDGGGAGGRKREYAAATNLQLQENMKALQDRLDLTVQKLSTAEINTRNLTRERDAALAQLGVAFCSSEDLKRENQVLVGANEALKDDLTRLQAEVEDQKQQWARKESSLLKKMRQRDEAVRDVRDVTREIRELQKPVERERTRPRHGSQVNNTARIQEPTETRAGLRDRNQTSDVTRDATDAYKTVKADPPIQASHAGRKGLGKSYPVDAHSRRQGIAAHDSGAAKTAEDEGARAPKRTRTRTIVVEETIHSGLSDADGYVTDPRQKNNDTRREPETDETVGTQASDTGDITNLSFLDEDVLVRLRKTLEAERIKQKDGRGAKGDAADEQKPVSRKPSLKAPRQAVVVDRQDPVGDGLTGKFSIKDGENTERLRGDAQTSKEPREEKAAGNPRGRVHASHGAKRSLGLAHTENMTSAYIIPDITMQHPLVEGEACTHKSVVGHGARDCTICQRSSWAKTALSAIHDAAEQKVKPATIKIPKPVPVSERMPQTVPGEKDEEEATMRPSQPPHVALAVVMKGLEDELAHLKLTLARYQGIYDRHDASLGKRKRKALCTKIAQLLKTIDVKADQIYALYDVLEGQKTDDDGQDERLEMTLQSIGINIDDLHLTDDRTHGKAGRGDGDDDGEGQSTKNLTSFSAQPLPRHGARDPNDDEEHRDARGSSDEEDDDQDDEEDDDDDDHLPWEGIDEETGYSTRSRRQ